MRKEDFGKFRQAESVEPPAPLPASALSLFHGQKEFFKGGKRKRRGKNNQPTNQNQIGNSAGEKETNCGHRFFCTLEVFGPFVLTLLRLPEGTWAHVVGDTERVTPAGREHQASLRVPWAMHPRTPGSRQLLYICTTDSSAPAHTASSAKNSQMGLSPPEYENSSFHLVPSGFAHPRRGRESGQEPSRQSRGWSTQHPQPSEPGDAKPPRHRNTWGSSISCVACCFGLMSGEMSPACGSAPCPAVTQRRSSSHSAAWDRRGYAGCRSRRVPTGCFLHLQCLC